MSWMNEWEVEDACLRVNPDTQPNLAQGVLVLAKLVNWTNRNSDGWPYWKKPSNAAVRLMTLIESVDRWSDDDIDAEALKKAITPIKAFYTRQGVT